jgi:23S rRNA pseudouridine1911/1915/1917 synthase
MRLDLYLAKEQPEFSRSLWQKYIKAGFVSVNGKVTTDFRARHDSDKITTNISKHVKQPLDLPVIYEDDQVIVIDKPAGVLTHSKGALNDEFTVADFVRLKTNRRLQAPSLQDFQENADPLQAPSLQENNRFGIVHRLDRATSGVIIAAKNDTAKKFLQKQFSDRKAHKTYLAIVEKAPKEPVAQINLPIARNPKKPSEFRVDPKGKPAITNYRVLETFNDQTALIELKPLTGRTHQLRVHLSSIGSPIVGDAIYNRRSIDTVSTKTASSTASSELAVGRRSLENLASSELAVRTVGQKMLLHALSLEITIPSDRENRRQIFTAEPPADFQKEIVKRRQECVWPS